MTTAGSADHARLLAMTAATTRSRPHPHQATRHRAGVVLRALTVAAVACLGHAPAQGQQTTLVPAGAVWKYLDDGSNQGTAWRAAGFNDGSWKSGAAELGYGDGDEATILSYGSNASAKYITTYFRRAFSVPDPSVYGSVALRVLRDDGAVVYLNGQEVFRNNMPSGTVSYTTFASSALDVPAESSYVTGSVNPALLVAGTNVLAVEIHQANATSSDISFNLELTASPGVSLTRGPYLQLGTPSSTVVRWRTSGPTIGRVQYGLTAGANTWAAQENTSTTEHVVHLTGLTPSTIYYYSIGTSTATLAGGDATHVFTTPPAAGTSKPTRVWVLGDSGTADANAGAVRDAYYAFTASRPTDLWLMLGDNAYNDGTDAEYQAAVFNMYPTLLRRSVLWPTLGNHDGVTADSASQSGPYYDIFTLPKSGEAGGLASGTEAYYSFDYGNIHFICLESFETNRSTTGPMLTWLQQDLASTSQPWIIVFFHHPPYSKGSHNSDTELPLVEMRQNALPILEAAGVDLVLSGHSHSYERSYLIDGHYGSSSTFSASMKKDAGSGREDGTGAYRKPTYGMAPREGAVYAVAGSSGKISGGLLNHPAMFISLNSLGSLVLDVNGNRLDATFLDHAGVRRDYFTILKGSAVPAAPTALTASAASASSVNLAWSDQSNNEDGFTVQRSTDGVSFATIATLAANTTSYANTGLTASTPYSYRVRAFNAAGASVYSNVASATTHAVVQPPAAPTSLSAQGVSAGTVRLTWKDNAGDESGFEIHRSADGVTFAAIATVGANGTTYTNSGLSRNKVYYFKVRAYKGSPRVYSAFSNTASVKVPNK